MPKTSSVTITSGVFRGRKLATPDTSATHPMGSREKLALFNALISAGADFSPSTRVLDLYAGSGALGLEAISRGAGSAVFVDNNAKARAAIKENIKSLGVERCQVLAGSFAKSQRSESRTSLLVGPSEAAISLRTTGAKDRELARNDGPSDRCPQGLDEFNFEVIIVDPPYDNFPTDLTPVQNLLAPGGFLALSHPDSVDPAEILPDLELITTKSHAASRISIYCKR